MHIFSYSITFIEFCIKCAGASAQGSSQRIETEKSAFTSWEKNALILSCLRRKITGTLLSNVNLTLHSICVCIYIYI